MNETPLTIAITGSSGSVLGIKLIEFFLKKEFYINVIFSNNAIKVSNHELNLNLSTDVELLKSDLLKYLSLTSYSNLVNVFANDDLFASVSSGSYLTQGMIIAPCSMNTLASIKNGIANNLITRAADVCLKQNKKLILAPREMPFNTTHLENMLSLSQKGVRIAVPCPAFYNFPSNIDDIINFLVGKILDTFEVPNDQYTRWK